MDGKDIFHKLEIARWSDYSEYLNKYNVIYIDFSRSPRNCRDYEQYISRIQDGMNEDLAKKYPELLLDTAEAVWDNLQAVFEKYRTRFVFVIDEWDAIFHKDFITGEDKKYFLSFLRDLLKGQPYVELAYMTGVLPVAKYSSGSELNMFKEYDMATKEKFGEYFGFLDSEVDRLFEIYQQTTRNAKIARKDLSEWYDGYRTAAGVRIYNPRSIIGALTDNQISNYWTSSGPYNEIFYYIRNNIKDIRDDLVLMVSGEHVKIRLQGYAAVSAELNTKNQIYSAMVVYGFLTYEDGEVFIPNRELMNKFDELLLSNESLGYVYNLARESEKMLRATLAGDTDQMAAILKVDGTPEDAIGQIKNKNYALRFKGKIGEKSKYTGRILAIGISYDRKSKEHFCKIEEL